MPFYANVEIAKLSKNEYVSMEVLVKVCTGLNVDFADVIEIISEEI